MSKNLLPENSTASRRCSTTEHRNESFVLADRLWPRRRQRLTRSAADRDRLHRVQRLLPKEAATKCILIAYLSAGGGAAFGYAVAVLFQVGGRS
jgi:hypothetical protein